MPKTKQADTDETVKTTLRLPKSLLRAAKLRAVDEGSLQNVINSALRQYLGIKGGK